MEDLKKSFLVRGNNIVGFGGSGEETVFFEYEEAKLTKPEYHEYF